MTNIEKLAYDLCKMKHCDKILKVLPSILEIGIQQGGDRKNEPSVLVGDVSIGADQAEITQQAG